MTNEQREAIDRLKKYIEEDDFYNIYKEIKEDEREGKIGGTHIVFCKAIDIALSLIKEQREKIEKYEKIYKEYDCYRWVKELDKRDEQINLMAEWISERCFYKDDYSNSCEIIQDSCSKEDDCKHCIKQYFERNCKNE